ncbi:N-acetylmuramoyl-L-alanine amidase [Panacibacter sp. DH6]|uniref:N-acetylmuramoyl-L-alanine amidase n=1 Tax=Panacibacter microcysteis TaxID=2793269 RepID=A0A931GWQ5_9BACT|nr:N-acetylmuramoyl-L-alanine amidase [Panacibacter microcysteis]MBG9376648.1 N-acetylmuramoyl-L-alanine amidase [Panacibacter microcysteis]
MVNKIIIIILAVTFFACSCNPYTATNKLYKNQAKAYGKVMAAYPIEDTMQTAAYFVGTTNFNMRKPNFVIIHHTAQNSCEQTLKTFTLQRTQVSAHYVICKDGTVHHMLNDYLRAWHAGAGKWGNDADINSSSIGIELDNNGFEFFPDAQMQSLLRLLAALKKNYNIPQANFIGHAEIAPARKNDPNIFFPWKELAGRGFGYWYDDTTNVIIPPNFDNMKALRIIGYDVKDSVAAIKTFKRHWLQDTSAVLTEADRKILFLVERKFN